MIRLAAKPVAEALREDIVKRVAAFSAASKRRPKLAVILVGSDPASAIYTSNKGKAAIDSGMDHESLCFDSDVSPEEVRKAVHRLNQDPTVDGILIQRPLPKSFNEEEVLYWVAPEKDVDAFHPINVGRADLGLSAFVPCTPLGVMEILKHYNISVAGKLACVVGRSSIVGKPMARLLMQANATIIHCHSQTKDLASLTKQADILVAAAGKMHLINASHIKKGAVVIDVGIHRKPDGKLAGDVDYDSAVTVASAVTPVPGGVGPMTITMLLANTVWSAEMSLKK